MTFNNFAMTLNYFWQQTFFSIYSQHIKTIWLFLGMFCSGTNNTLFCCLKFCLMIEVSRVTRLGDLLDNFLKPLATMNLSKSLAFLGIFVKMLKSVIFLVKSFLGNFYRHLAIFFWSHWRSVAFQRCLWSVE